MTELEVDQNFRQVGAHFQRAGRGQTIGSKGLGRFSVFALGYRAAWKTVATQGQEMIEQSWVMTRDNPAPAEIVSRVLPNDSATGTEVEINVDPGSTVARSFLISEAQVKRSIFYAFAPRLAVAEGELDLIVNGESIKLTDYVDDQEEELIAESASVPEARLLHFLVNARVQAPHQKTLLFTQNGSTVSEVDIEGDAISGRKYIGVLRSPYLDQARTATDKRSFIEDDERLPELIAVASHRARDFAARQVASDQKTFIERARSMDGYPYGDPPKSQIERFERTLYEGVLTAINEIVGHPIWGGSPEKHKFRFVLVSSEVSPEIAREYQEGEDFGLVSKPKGFAHQVEMFAVQWSDFINDRRGELAYLQSEIESTSDPELLEYLRSALPNLPRALPESVAGGS